MDYTSMRTFRISFYKNLKIHKEFLMTIIIMMIFVISINWLYKRALIDIFTFIVSKKACSIRKKFSVFLNNIYLDHKRRQNSRPSNSRVKLARNGVCVAGSRVLEVVEICETRDVTSFCSPLRPLLPSFR